MGTRSTKPKVMEEGGTPPPLRVKQIAAFFDVDPSTIYRAIASGELGAYRVGGKTRGPLRVPQESFEAYRASRSLGTVAA